MHCSTRFFKIGLRLEKKASLTLTVFRGKFKAPRSYYLSQLPILLDERFGNMNHTIVDLLEIHRKVILVILLPSSTVTKILD